MGQSTSKVLGDIGGAIASAVAAPIKSIFGRSCQDVCGGMWDVVCFIEHICILDLFRFLLACCLCYICLVFLYLFYKLGLCQCILRSLCKMCWAACETYWFTLDYVCCYCWHRIRYTKRVYRGHHQQRLRRHLSSDIEMGYISPRRRRMRRRRRRRRRRCGGGSVRLRRGQVSVRLSGRSRRQRKGAKSKSKCFQSRRSLGRRRSRRCESTSF